VSGRYLTDLADVCRAAGLAVVEVDGGQTRARGSGGYTGDRPWLVMWHHTASSTTPDNDVAYICHGADAAPLANLYVARDGTVYVCAAGATNTNGSGGPLELPSGRTVPVDQANTHAIGVEMGNNGVGEAWPIDQIDAMFALSAAMSWAYGFAVDDVGTHESYAPGRKIDPATAAAVAGSWQPDAVTTSGTWSLSDVRAELNRRTNPTPLPPDPEQDDDMAAPFIITNTDTGQIILIYGDGKTAGLAGPDLPGYVARFGQPIPTDPTVCDAIISKG
jgi:hypothetical protein